MKKSCETDTLVQKPLTSVSDVVDRMGFGKFQWWLLIMYSLIIINFATQSFMIGVLAYILDNNWDLSDLSIGFYSGTMLLAMGTGCLLSTLFEDKLTRWGLTKLSLLIIIVFSVISAVCQEIVTLTLSRFMVILGTFLLLSPSLSSTCEMFPSKKRGTLLAICGATGIIGYSLVTGFSYAFMPNFEGEEWRYMVAFLGPLPCIGALILAFYLIEDSPVYLAKRNKHNAAVAGLERMAHMNRLRPLSEIEKDIVMNQKEEMKKMVKFMNLFENEIKKQSVVLVVLWIITIVGYNGVLSVYPYLLDQEDDSETIYLNFLLLIVSEIPAMGIYIYIVDNPKIGRKIAMIGFSVTMMICLLLPIIYYHDITIVVSVSIYVAFRYDLLVCLMLYTSEIYQTELRASATAYFNMLARAVSIGVPPLLLFLIDLNHTLAFVFLGVLEVIAFVCIFLLPLETRGIVLDSVKKV